MSKEQLISIYCNQFIWLLMCLVSSGRETNIALAGSRLIPESIRNEFHVRLSHIYNAQVVWLKLLNDKYSYNDVVCQLR